MKKNLQKIFALAIVIVMLSIVGCGQPETPNDRMSRLIAVENSRLKKELELYKSQIERLTMQHNLETKKQEKLLADCIQERESWKKKAQQNVKNQVEGVFDAVMEQNAKLIEENKKLKAEIEKLRN